MDKSAPNFWDWNTEIAFRVHSWSKNLNSNLKLWSTVQNVFHSLIFRASVIDYRRNWNKPQRCSFLSPTWNMILK